MCLDNDRTLYDRLVCTATLLRGWLGSLVLWMVSSGPRTCRPTWMVICCLSHNFGFRDGVEPTRNWYLEIYLA